MRNEEFDKEKPGKGENHRLDETNLPKFNGPEFILDIEGGKIYGKHEYGDYLKDNGMFLDDQGIIHLSPRKPKKAPLEPELDLNAGKTSFNEALGSCLGKKGITSDTEGDIPLDQFGKFGGDLYEKAQSHLIGKPRSDFNKFGLGDAVKTRSFKGDIPECEITYEDARDYVGGLLIEAYSLYGNGRKSGALKIVNGLKIMPLDRMFDGDLKHLDKVRRAISELEGRL